jgi:ribosomal protein S18 acetylase RimI-like enzyme
MTRDDIAYREDTRPSDEAAVAELVASTGFFSDCEVELAVELVRERNLRGPASGYHFLIAELDGEVAAYACFGKIDCTASSYDLFWIATRAARQGRGLGKRLLARTEELILARGGRRVYAETSSRGQYAPTRRFYERCGYRLAATIDDFYAEGDGKVVYEKIL